MEFFTDTILYWVPFYFTIKTIFVLYLYLPQFNGASIMYTKVFIIYYWVHYVIDLLYFQVIRPYFTKHEDAMDDAVKQMKSKVTDFTSSDAVKAAKAKLDSVSGSFSKTD